MTSTVRYVLRTRRRLKLMFAHPARAMDPGRPPEELWLITGKVRGEVEVNGGGGSGMGQQGLASVS